MRLPELSTSGAVRFAGLLAALAGIALCYSIGHQASLAAEKGRLAREEQHQRYLANWRRLMALRTASPASERDSRPARPFTPAAFQQEGARLVSWHPSAEGGELALDTPWAQVPPAFTRLAERDMQVVAFSLIHENGALRFRLRLVRDDKP